MTDSERPTGRAPDSGRGPLAERLDDPRAPAALEDRVVATLARRGVLAVRSPAAAGRWARGAGTIAAAALIAFVLGWVGGSRAAADRQAAAGGNRYALLLYEPGGGLPVADPAESARIVAEYAGWARELAGRGHEVSGEKLGERATVVGALPARGMGDAASRTLGGFFIVSAADSAEALAIAGTCPHLRYGGEIEVRPIDPT